MSRIGRRFEALRAQDRKAFIAFVTTGDPSLERTVEIAVSLDRAGVDVLELGVPFSDPMADGPVIQRSSERALKHGVSLKHVLGYVAEFRKADRLTPVVVFGYANPIEAMGIERFADAVRAADADGVLVVDYPPEEALEFSRDLKASGIDAIFLLAPTTTDERIAAISRQASGFLYYVSLKGTTGARHLDVASVEARVPLIRRHSDLPIGVGFGIRDAASAHAVAQVADAVVIGARIIEEIEAAPERAVHAVERLLGGLRRAIDNAPAEKAA